MKPFTPFKDNEPKSEWSVEVGGYGLRNHRCGTDPYQDLLAGIVANHIQTSSNLSFFKALEVMNEVNKCMCILRHFDCFTENDKHVNMDYLKGIINTLKLNRNGAQLCDIHVDFLEDTYAYVFEGKPRKMMIASWERALNKDANPQSRYSTTLALQARIDKLIEDLEYHHEFGINLLGLWHSNANGFNDFLYTINILFGRPLSGNPNSMDRNCGATNYVAPKHWGV